MDWQHSSMLVWCLRWFSKSCRTPLNPWAANPAETAWRWWSMSHRTSLDSWSSDQPLYDRSCLETLTAWWQHHSSSPPPPLPSDMRWIQVKNTGSQREPYDWKIVSHGNAAWLGEVVESCMWGPLCMLVDCGLSEARPSYVWLARVECSWTLVPEREAGSPWHKSRMKCVCGILHNCETVGGDRNRWQDRLDGDPMLSRNDTGAEGDVWDVHTVMTEKRVL